MASGTLANPGTEFGPCLEPCSHMDCQQTIEMAETGCRICNDIIGYDRHFFQERSGVGESFILVHASCLHDEAVSEKRAAEKALSFMDRYSNKGEDDG